MAAGGGPVPAGSESAASATSDDVATACLKQGSSRQSSAATALSTNANAVQVIEALLGREAG